MSRPGIGPRIQRMLTLIPWLRAHPEGVPVAEVCARFGIDRNRLLADIDALANVGVEPYLPGDALEVRVEDDRLFAFIPLSFTRPLRISPPQALALVAAGQALIGATGEGEDGPLGRALAKLARTLGIDPADAVNVDLGTTGSERIAVLRTALDAGTQVEIDYYTASRDDRSTRTVDPHQLVSMGGRWYLSAHCHLAGGDRLFRLDRITAVRPLDAAVEDHPDREPLGRLNVDDRTPRVSARLSRTSRWVLDTIEVDHAQQNDDGTVEAVLPVASVPWLERLLLQLGPEVTVTADPSGVVPDVAAAAAAILDRYRSPRADA